MEKQKQIERPEENAVDTLAKSAVLGTAISTYLSNPESTEDALIKSPEKEYSRNEKISAISYIKELPEDFSPEKISSIIKEIPNSTTNHLSNTLFLTKTYLDDNNSDEKLRNKAGELFRDSLKKDFDKTRAIKFYKILQSLSLI